MAILSQQVVFIGAGSMAEALLAGLMRKGLFSPEEVTVTNRANNDRLAEMNRRYGVRTSRQLEEVAQAAGFLILAVKPRDTVEVLGRLRGRVGPGQLLLSLAAGITTAQVERLLQTPIAVIRAMPNTSCAVGESATALAANTYATKEERALVERLFSAVGQVQWLQEADLDAATALAGCGPAYIYYLLEAMQQGGETLGLEPDVVRRLTLQTLVGAAKMLQQGEGDPKELRSRITSPGGATEAGIRVMEQAGLADLLVKAMRAACFRSREMGEELQRTSL